MGIVPDENPQFDEGSRESLSNDGDHSVNHLDDRHWGFVNEIAVERAESPEAIINGN